MSRMYTLSVTLIGLWEVCFYNTRFWISSYKQISSLCFAYIIITLVNFTVQYVYFIFISYIYDDIISMSREMLNETRVVSIMFDGATDVSVCENELYMHE